MIKIKNFTFTCFYILIVIYLLAFVPTIWGKKPLVTISGSMEPTLKVGSLFYYQDSNYDLNVGDILVYKTKYNIISHRIAKINADGTIITKGDANNSVDSKKVDEKQIIGKANNWCIPYYGFYVELIYKHKFLLYGVIILLLFDTLFEWYKERKYLKCKRE